MISLLVNLILIVILITLNTFLSNVNLIIRIENQL